MPLCGRTRSSRIPGNGRAWRGGRTGIAGRGRAERRGASRAGERTTRRPAAQPSPGPTAKAVPGCTSDSTTWRPKARARWARRTDCARGTRRSRGGARTFAERLRPRRGCCPVDEVWHARLFYPHGMLGGFEGVRSRVPSDVDHAPLQLPVPHPRFHARPGGLVPSPLEVIHPGVAARAGDDDRHAKQQRYVGQEVEQAAFHPYPRINCSTVGALP